MNNIFGRAIHMLREAIALYYPSPLQPDSAVTASSWGPAEKALALVYEASAPLDPNPEHFLGFTWDGTDMTRAMVMLNNVADLAKTLKLKTHDEKVAHWHAVEAAWSAGDVSDLTEANMPTLPVGTVVKAKVLLDQGVTNIQPGTLGYVFGESGCYGYDGPQTAGPIVQWITIKWPTINELLPEGGIPVGQLTTRLTPEMALKAEKVCNIYPGDVEIVRVHKSVDLVHI